MLNPAYKKHHQERPESPPGPLGVEDVLGVDFPAIFIQIHGDLAGFKPNPESPGGSEGVATHLIRKGSKETPKGLCSETEPLY